MLILELNPETKEIVDYPLLHTGLYRKFPNTSFPSPLTAKDLPENHFEVVTPNGRSIDMLRDRSEKPVYNNELRKWTIENISPTERNKPKVPLAELKIQKLAELAKNADNLVNRHAGVDVIPQAELQTWVLQSAEAMQWKKDPTSSTPILEAIAKIRGVNLNELREKAYQKAYAYQQLVTYVVGMRQAIEDQIVAVNTEESLAAININIQLPTPKKEVQEDNKSD